MMRWGNTDLWTLADHACPYLLSEYYAVISAILTRIYLDFPDRTARKASILCASTPDYTNCAGHPPGAHSNGKAIDLCYYTLGETNHTQIPVGTERVTPIFVDGKLPEMFDPERNYVLLSSIWRTTGAEIRVHSKIRRAIEDFVWKDCPWLKIDDNPLYAHDKHAHIAPQEVVWDALI